MPNRSRQALEAALHNPEFEDVSSLTNVKVDLRYATKHNLLQKDVYGGFGKALLHRIAAEKFRHASTLLSKRREDLKFLVFDALRPQAAQEEFWRLVKGTPQQQYFADPAKGSIHSYGFAIDLGLIDRNGQELDMGTGFDDLTELAEPRREAELLAAGALNETQIANRLILRSLMQESGFLQLPHEWWHFDALPGNEVRASYQRCE